MTKVGKRQFRAHQARYLRAAQRGETVVITEGGKPVIEVRAASTSHTRERITVPPPRPKAVRRADPFKGISFKLPPGSARQMIDDERGE